MNSINRLSAILLRSPLVWGSTLSIAFFAPIEAGYWTDPDVLRYAAGHWVEYVEVIMFFIGLAALVIKALDVLGQLRCVDAPLLAAPASGGDSPEDAAALVSRLDQSVAGRHGYLPRRLRALLENVRRRGAAEGIDNEIKYLSDLDAAAAAQSYAFVRIVIWAIPILGFLGTVIGITIAIANLSPEHLEESLPEVTAGLGVAFDTTALALGLSMVLMFVQFGVDRAEQRLLTKVDDRVNAEMLGRFQVSDVTAGPDVSAMRRMMEVVLSATDRLVARQAELWQGTIDAAQARWRQLADGTTEQVEATLSGALTRSLEAHARELATSEQRAAEQNRRHWQEVQQSLVEATRGVQVQQAELTRQGEVLGKVLEAQGDIISLEQSLNRNLHALAGAKHFEETVVTLAATVQLLSARIGPTAELQTVKLPRGKRTDKAA